MSSTTNPAEPILSKWLLRPEDVVELIPGLSVKLLAQWRYERRGPRYYKVGRIVLYPFEDLEQWFEAQVGASGSER
ncbi:helix-turn-helix domain-containing protein [Microbacterium sp. zg.B48]|uniref:helix-turn-helix transcriptional regulator n=1 Tax=Microbacterium sp. zg.B48 TaxID=2969408 RepID=UPI00214CDA8B|nr:helix-turn-helix domain-containing protein [Microbacterium sp. zg.B48]MCR2764974.1 helix-turn-helix domain-containing protein [Microbacterium sp. zg.B48]